MKTLREEPIFNCSAESLWNILSDVSRCDWVPTIDEISLEGDYRIFEMEGMGSVKEKILHLDNESMKLQYSAVETKMPIEHLATMQVLKINKSSCQLKWSTEIDPEIFAESIHQGMLVSIEGIKAVIANEAE
jgi:hypothetical protein